MTAPDLRPPVAALRQVILLVRHKLPRRDSGWSLPSSAVLVAIPADLDPESPPIRTMLTQVATNLGASLHGTDWTVLPHRGHGRTPTPDEVSETAAWWSRLLGVPVVDDPAAVAVDPRPLSWRP